MVQSQTTELVIPKREITDDFIDDYHISMETRLDKNDKLNSMDVYYSITPFN